MAQYISSFTITIICTIVLNFILRSLMPEGNIEKYVNFVIGIIVSITLVSSFASVGAIDFDDIFEIPGQNSITKQQAEDIYNERIAESFKKNLSNRISEIVYINFGNDCSTDIMLQIDTNGEILGVDGIYVSVYGNCDTEKIRDIVASELDVDKQIVHIGGEQVD